MSTRKISNVYKLMTVSSTKQQELISLYKDCLSFNGCKSRGKIDDPQLKSVNLPQAESEFYPPLFYRSEKHRSGSRMGIIHIREAYYALFSSLSQLGISINSVNNDLADVVFNWSYKVHLGSDKARIYLEHGWLPRSSFQISSMGTNARSHVANEFHARKQSELRKDDLLHSTSNLKSLFSLSVRQEKVKQIKERIKSPFILFAFQLANDANLKYSNSDFSKYFSIEQAGSIKFAQACIDCLSSYSMPLPVIYKQHPVDRNNIHLCNKKADDIFFDNSCDYTTHEIFSSGLCKLVITVNSNTLHEASIWGVPGIALGTMIWNEAKQNRPYSNNLNDIESIIDSKQNDDNLLLYIQHLLENQWSTSDLQNPLIVKELLDNKACCNPFKLRSKYKIEL